MSVQFLSEDSMIAGSRKTYTFEVYSEIISATNPDGVPASLPIVSGKMLFCPYGQYSQTVLIRSGTVNSNQLVVVLQPEDTVDMSGVYAFQLLIVDSEGNKFRPAEGYLVITPAMGSRFDNRKAKVYYTEGEKEIIRYYKKPTPTGV